MEKPNMIRNSADKNQSSIFQFDSYPGQSSTDPWDNKRQENDLNLCARLQNAQIFSDFLPMTTVHQLISPQIPSSFSFGSSYSTVTTTTPLLTGRFPIKVPDHGSPDHAVRLILGKRKTNSPPLQPCKQHITEEKMVEHMSKLHISSETASSPLEPESVRNKRLYMCEKMRKLKSEPLLPAALVAHIQQPCTALVLWQPPSKVLPTSSVRSSGDISTEEESDNDTDKLPANSQLDAIDMDNEFIGNMDMDT